MQSFFRALVSPRQCLEEWALASCVLGLPHTCLDISITSSPNPCEDVATQQEVEREIS